MTSCSFHIVIDHTDNDCNIQRIDSIQTSECHGDDHHYYCESTKFAMQKSHTSYAMPTQVLNVVNAVRNGAREYEFAGAVVAEYS